jgi:hypothetical protein
VAERLVALPPARERGAIVSNLPSLLKDPPVFEPEVTHAMGAAFDEVCRALSVADDAEAIREALAGKIILHARRGEHDPDRLRDAVLREIGASSRLASSRRVRCHVTGDVANRS